ncbi:L,D-transpeptidase family protein [Halioxenophilus aromaticivorans]|uniref:L,D-transpeptidase family protein n=1 Tax=Halioxenophilus aromaticivorans TaxID=1306992 RepID=UPI0031EA590C
MELHFYPGQKVLVLQKGITVLGRYEAWGGPSTISDDPSMPEEPTWPGSYVIERAEKYRTPTWPWSQIKWGTKLQDKPDLNDVWYQLSSGAWGSVKKDFNITREHIRRSYLNLYRVDVVPNSWVFNDFGPVAIRWFKDTNGDRTLNDDERLSGQMFHTTPENEAQHSRSDPIRLSHSHGCIHLKPSDREIIFTRGGFEPGTPFIVHKYHERYQAGADQ